MDHLVDATWLEAHLHDPDLRILDSHVVFERSSGTLVVESGRSLWERGHIPRSDHVDLVEELADTTLEHRFMMPSSDIVADAMSRHGVGTGTRVVLYDRDRNMWAARVWWMLRAVGFYDTAILDGGWMSWIAEDRPVSRDPAPRFDRGQFVVEAQAGVFVGKDEVREAIDDPDVCLVNALGEDEHRGRSTNYGRRGHIPTAVNVPAAGLVNESHRYVDRDSLRRRMAPVLTRDRAITYCGGGISAASDAFVLFLLGRKDIGIYDASMSEWGADPSLPLTRNDD